MGNNKKEGNKKDSLRERLKEQLKKNRETFEKQYPGALDYLRGLSTEDIDKITPNITARETYDKLIAVVEKASEINESQARLKSRIEKLGAVAIEIAKNVPGLKNFLD